MPQLGLSATVDGDWGVLVVSGEVDLAAAPELRTCLAELADVGVRHLVVDLRRVTFLDSTGVGVLVAAARRLGGADPAGSLRLACTDERVLRVLRLTGVLGCSRCRSRSRPPAPSEATLPPTRPVRSAAAN
jgi:anti-anti-sigma factor